MNSPSKILDKLAEPTITHTADKLLKVLRKEWDSSRQGLVEALDSRRPPMERANATLLLFKAGDDAFIEGFTGLFSQDTDCSVLESLLEGIVWSVRSNESLEQTLQADSISTALQHTITKSKGKLLDRALRQLYILGKVDSLKFLDEQLAAASGPRKLQIALVLGGKTDHPPAWNTIAAEAHGTPPQNWPFRVRNAVTKHLTSPDKDLAREAETLLACTIDHFIDDKEFSIEQSTSLSFLKNSKLPESLPAILKLEERFSNGRDSVIEGEAIEARARLEEQPSIADLELRLSDPAVSYSAASSLLAQGSDPPDDALLKKLVEASRCCYGSSFERFMVLIRDCGHPDAHDRVRTVLEEKTPGLVLRILGQSEGWDAKRLGALAAECGLLPSPPTPAQIQEAEELCEEPNNLDDLASAILSLGGCLIEFDLEADKIPPDYEEFIRKLASISGGQFRPTCIRSEPLPSNDGASNVSFRAGDQSYDFTTQGLGDWIDEATVLKALNNAVASAGGLGRFLPFEPHGQHLQVVFAKPMAVEEFSKHTKITLAKNFDNDSETSVPRKESPVSFWARLGNKFKRPKQE